jgi:3-oxoadipate enol-lactonase
MDSARISRLRSRRSLPVLTRLAVRRRHLGVRRDSLSIPLEAHLRGGRRSGPRRRLEMEMRVTEIDGTVATAADGTRLSVIDRGSGEPFLLIPGLGYAAWSFTRQLGPFSSAARVLAMDNRGSGHSDKPAGPYSIAQMADDAFAVLSQRGAIPAHVVGTSMGGYIALTLALRHPQAVQSLVLLATTSGGRGSLGVPTETLRIWSKAATSGVEDFARASMPFSFAPGWVEAHQSEFEELLALRLSTPTPIDAWRAQFDACATFLRTGLPLKAITQPVTIIHGTADRVVPYANAAHLSRSLPQARVVTLKGAGHLCWIERADAVNTIILNSIGLAETS